MDRRTFVSSSTVALGFTRFPLQPPTPRSIKAVLFDAFPIFDPRPIAGLATQLFPQQGQLLMAQWRSRQFEYTWLRTAGGQYRDFWHTTSQALTAAARSLGLALSPAQHGALLDGFLHLKAWPDVTSTLATLRARGLRLGFLSNFTGAMLAQNIASAGLDGAFDYVLSTDLSQHFKPAPEAYQLGLSATGLTREEIAFAAFAGWDAAGAKWFGYPTAWINRLAASSEELDATPDRTGPDLQALLDLVSAS